MKVQFSAILAEIEKCDGALVELSKHMLATMKEAKASSLEAFNGMVSEAYDANGWSQVAGRPSAESTLKPAPDTVKMYVSNIRAAYRLKLDVLSFVTIGELRSAVKEVRAAARVPKEATEPALQGVHVVNTEEMTGALWHDLLTLRQNLPEISQIKFDEECRKLLVRYIKAAPEFLHLVKAA